MDDVIPKVLKWLQQRWSRASAWLKILYILFFVALIALAVHFLPWFKTYQEWYGKAHPDAQASVLVFGLVALLAFFLWAVERARRVDDLKVDVEKLKGENAELKTHLDATQAEAEQHQALWDHLLEVESKTGLWQRKCSVPPPEFVPKGGRKTRFLTVLNLKGGVGKTTLAANVAAGLALAKPGFRVLLIDIDFQGTLGHACVDPTHIDAQIRHMSFVNGLLLEPPSGTLLNRLRVPMHQVPGVDVVLATDTLDADEFQLQARFFLDESADPRFQFRRHLHGPHVFDHYDLVVFDCPPRVTVSVVNALACSDGVLIPTRLDRGSIDAVPRTYKWVRSLGGVCPAELVGVVACHVSTWRDRMTNADRDSFETLRGRVQSECGGDAVFKAHIPYTAHAVGPCPGSVASLSTTGRQVFVAVVTELRARMNV